MVVASRRPHASEAYLERLDYAVSRAVPASVVAIAQPEGSSAALVERVKAEVRVIPRELRSAFPKAPQSYLVGFAKAGTASRDQSLKKSLTKTAAVPAHYLALQLEHGFVFWK